MSFRSLVKVFIPRQLFRKIEPWGHLGEAVLFNLINGFPARKLNVIGITGTNGKSTTAFLVHRMMHQNGYKVGLMTTVGWGVGDDITPETAHMTNVAVPELMRRIKRMKKEGMEWLVMETTSHALAQNRTWGLPYGIAMLTNITHDHRDYHGSFENYRQAKLKLFKMTDRNSRGLRAGVINADDPSASLFEAEINNPQTYGIDHGSLRAKNVKLSAAGSSYQVEVDGESYSIKCQLPGRFNVYNSLAAVGVGRLLDLKPEQVEQGIAALESVAGRMNSIDAGQDFSVIIDYAHTPDALKNALTALKEMAGQGRVIAVFGATGNRDKAKRPEMGRVAAELADHIFLTDDETYDEESADIIKAVYTGIEEGGGEAKTDVIADRRAAIEAAFKFAKASDVVLLAGLGHQDHRVMKEGKLPWVEADVTRQVIKSL